MRDYEKEFESRVSFVKELLAKSGAKGIVYGNSGGKDSALVGIICKAACDNTVGILMPCVSQRNFSIDLADGREVAEKFNIETRMVDLTTLREQAVKSLETITDLTPAAIANIAPRLRMTTLYAVAGTEGRLVAGTGNASEAYMGYFTKWGDGAYDFNPIADLTVTEIFEFLAYLDAPMSVRTKAPSAGLFEGQTDESEMGISYAKIDQYLLTGTATEEDKKILDRFHNASEHKRVPQVVYGA
ncbi:MAG: NAD(+) synthase [Oscillospiraceae bacterium]|nr:NAD(+) synthase [Oscillospiraceae bacterium]